MRRSAVFVVLALVAAHAAAAESPHDSKPSSTQPSGRVLAPPHLKARLTTPTPAYSVTYQYDSLGRLITATKDTHASNFTYDAAGNRTVSSEQ